MLASIVHIQPLVTLRRERILPLPGKVLVRKGQKVAASDVIAEADLNPEHVVLDIARGLGLPGDQADRHIQCKVGTTVTTGDVLAGPVGFFKRVIRTPYNGEVVFTGGGQIMIKRENPLYELKAGLPGTVVELIDERGAIITNTGALIQGVWGNDRIDGGLLVVLAKQTDDILTSDRLDISLRGSVVLAGHCSQAEALKTASELPLRGLILASMDARLVVMAQKIKVPIIVLEGFGQFNMDSVSFKLLSTNENRDVSINAESWDRFTGRRPEVIIPLPAPEEMPMARETLMYTSGQTIRVIGSPYWGKTGRINQLLPTQATITNGLKVEAAEVRLENGDTVLLPLTNLEVIE
jgi:hypothetical protein